MAFSKLFAFSALAASLATSNAALTRRVTCSDGSTTANQACCAFFPLLDHLQNNLFNNECGQDVREALRLTFHDGVGFSPTLGGGGSDGSIIDPQFAATEEGFAGNNDGGLSDAVNFLQPLIAQFNVSAGDLVYFASAVGISNCPGAPKLDFLAGRPPPIEASPPGLVSVPTDTVDMILQRFSEVGFSSDEVVALLASHSLAAADAFAGQPFDSTPANFDSQFFVETQLDASIPGSSFVEGQDQMRSAFAAVMLKLSLVAQDQSSLIDCSDVIPGAKAPTGDAPYFPGTATITNVQSACAATPFPTLTQNPAVTSLAPVLEHST